MTEKPKTVLHNDCLTAPEHISLGFGASRVSLRARKPTSPTDWQPTLKPAEMEDVLIMVLMLAEGCKAGLFQLFHFFIDKCVTVFLGSRRSKHCLLDDILRRIYIYIFKSIYNCFDSYIICTRRFEQYLYNPSPFFCPGLNSTSGSLELPLGSMILVCVHQNVHWPVWRVLGSAAGRRNVRSVYKWTHKS
jgi:hypothetical protein